MICKGRHFCEGCKGNWACSKNRNQELVLAVQKLMKISANVLKLGYGLSSKENIEILDI